MATIKIPLNNYKYALIDEIDIPFINRYQWRAAERRSVWYVQTAIKDHEDKPRTLYLARLIMNARDGEEVDHIDHDPLNNTRDNLRLCTQSQNNRNTRARKSNKSGFKGVYWSRQMGKWHAQIHSDKKRHIGFYATAEDAARAYDRVAREFFGKFAYLNFPGEV